MCREMGHLLSSGESPKGWGVWFSAGSSRRSCPELARGYDLFALGRVGTWGWVWLEVPLGALHHPGLVGLCLQ